MSFPLGSHIWFLEEAAPEMGLNDREDLIARLELEDGK